MLQNQRLIGQISKTTWAAHTSESKVSTELLIVSNLSHRMAHDFLTIDINPVSGNVLALVGVDES